MSSYTFTNTSGYNTAVARLKDQILSIEDDNSKQLILSTSFFDYAVNENDVSSQDNYPVFVIESAFEELKSDSRQNSDITFNCFMIFNDANTEFSTIFNQIISTIRKQLLETYDNEFKIISIDRSAGFPVQLGGSSKYLPFWSCKLVIQYNSVIY